MSAQHAHVCMQVVVSRLDGLAKGVVWAGDDGHGDASACEISEYVLWRGGEEWDEAAFAEVVAMCGRCSIRSAGFNGVQVIR